MVESFKSFYSSTTSNGDYNLIPLPNGSSRDLASLQEIHDLMITASSRKASLDENWKIRIDVYIKDDENNSYYLYNYLVFGDGDSYHNEKTFVLRSNQSLWYSVNNINGGIVNVTSSCIQTNDIGTGVQYCTFEVIPDPVDANVLIECGSVRSTNGKITVPKGSNVTYTVSYPLYKSESNTVQIDQDESISVTLDPLYCVRINTNAEDATISMTSSVPGYEQEGDTIYVPIGTSVSWTVSAPHYTTKSSSDAGEEPVIVDTEDVTKQVTLEYQNYTYTINPDPYDAIVRLVTKSDVTYLLRGWIPSDSDARHSARFYTLSATPQIDDDIYNIIGYPIGKVIQGGSRIQVDKYPDVIFKHSEKTIRIQVYSYEETNTQTVPYKTQLRWQVLKDNYYTQDFTVTVEEDTVNNVELVSRVFVQPTLQSNGVMGENEFACDQGKYITVDGVDQLAYHVFEDNDSVWDTGTTNSYLQKCWIAWYNPTPLILKKLRIKNGLGKYSYWKYKVLGSNTNYEKCADWIELCSGTNNNTTDNDIWEIDLSSNYSSYKYHRLWCYPNARNTTHLQVQNLYIDALTA